MTKKSEDKKYCNTECYANHKKIGSYVNCFNCGLEFYRVPKHQKRLSNRNFCSKGCFGSFYSGENNPAFVGNREDRFCWKP